MLRNFEDCKIRGTLRLAGRSSLEMDFLMRIIDHDRRPHVTEKRGRRLLGCFDAEGRLLPYDSPGLEHESAEERDHYLTKKETRYRSTLHIRPEACPLFLMVQEADRYQTENRCDGEECFYLVRVLGI